MRIPVEGMSVYPINNLTVTELRELTGFRRRKPLNETIPTDAPPRYNPLTDPNHPLAEELDCIPR